MDKDDEEISRDEGALLYTSALNKLKAGEPLDFDQEELLDIYDYALNADDMWVSNEVMEYTLRNYPDFKDMLERKAVALLELNELEGAKAVAETLPRHSFIRRLVLAALDWNSEKWEEGYRNLSKGLRQKDLYDYETNTLVNFALDYDSPKNLAAVYMNFTPFCAFPETFIASIVSALYDDNEYDAALPLLVELTEMEPFSVEHWVDLASYYINTADNLEEGSNALEYALAIDPMSKDALSLKADMLIKEQADEKALFEHAAQMEAAGLADQASMFRASAYLSKGEFKKASELLLGKVDSSKNAVGIYLLLLSIVTEETVRTKIRDEFFSYVRNAPQKEIENWTNALTEDASQQENFSIYPLFEAMEEAGKEISQSAFSRFMAWEVVRRNLGAVIKMYEVRVKSAAVSPFDALTFILACENEKVHLDKLKSLLDMCAAELKDNYEIIDTRDLMLIAGINHLFDSLNTRLSEGRDKSSPK